MEIHYLGLLYDPFRFIIRNTLFRYSSTSTISENKEEIEQQQEEIIDNDSSQQQNSNGSGEVSEKMEKIVNDFTEDVEERIERQIEEIFTIRIPSELVMPYKVGNVSRVKGFMQ